MTLAQAIRKGSRLHEQTTGAMRDEAEVDGTTYYLTCALGAAFVGFFDMLPGADEFDALESLRNVFPELATRVVCPGIAYAHGPMPSLGEAIAALNDEDGWTREQIADWVESLNLNGATR